MGLPQNECLKRAKHVFKYQSERVMPLLATRFNVLKVNIILLPALNFHFCLLYNICLVIMRINTRIPFALHSDYEIRQSMAPACISSSLNMQPYRFAKPLDFRAISLDSWKLIYHCHAEIYPHSLPFRLLRFFLPPVSRVYRRP